MFIKYKKDFLWLLITLFIMIVVSLAQMYSREVTIYKVHKNEFRLFSKILDNKYANDKYFKKVTSQLITKKGYALFQIALVSNNKCIENTSHYYNNPLICSFFKNFNQVQEVLDRIKNKKPYFYEFSTKDLNIDDKESNGYLIKKLKYTKNWLIAKNNLFLYSKGHELDNFIHFMIHRYIQSNGYKKIFTKGKFLFLIVGVISLLLWLVNKFQNRKRLIQYRKSSKSKKDILKKIEQYKESYNQYKLERYEQQQIIKQKEEELQNSKKSKEEIKKLEEEIYSLYEKEEKFKQVIESNKEKIIRLEQKEEKLQQKLSKELSKLSEYERNIEQLKIDNKIILLKKLWSNEPTWMERKEIEQIASLKKTNLPFTLTQAFIAFDKSILNQARVYDSNINSYNSNMCKNIDLIIKYKKLSVKLENELHEIRKARNRWFHSGIYPNYNIVNNLIKFLNDIDADVFI